MVCGGFGVPQEGQEYPGSKAPSGGRTRVLKLKYTYDIYVYTYDIYV